MGTYGEPPPSTTNPTRLGGGFSPPIWKICSSNWIISPSRVDNEKSINYLKPPTSLSWSKRLQHIFLKGNGNDFHGKIKKNLWHLQDICWDTEDPPLRRGLVNEPAWIARGVYVLFGVLKNDALSFEGFFGFLGYNSTWVDRYVQPRWFNKLNSLQLHEVHRRSPNTDLSQGYDKGVTGHALRTFLVLTSTVGHVEMELPRDSLNLGDPQKTTETVEWLTLFVFFGGVWRAVYLPSWFFFWDISLIYPMYLFSAHFWVFEDDVGTFSIFNCWIWGLRVSYVGWLSMVSSGRSTRSKDVACRVKWSMGGLEKIGILIMV